MSFFILVVALLALDAVWLTLRKNYHTTLFYSIQRSPLEMNWIAAPFVYLLLAGAIWYITHGSKSAKEAMLKGAAVGAVMYGFYDFTNMATLTRWTWEMVVTDTLWGTVASASAAGIAYWALKQKLTVF
jgi:uncharacterized membrane protein